MWVADRGEHCSGRTIWDLIRKVFQNSAQFGNQYVTRISGSWYKTKYRNAILSFKGKFSEGPE